ncbi:PREDICTED: phosphatidylinositol 4-kinase alpha 1-like, partial [Camelina sativa]
AVMAAAAAASGANLKTSGAFNLEVLSTSVVSATVKCNHTGQIAGMLRLENSVGGFSINEMLISNSVRLLQQFVSTAEKGG